MLDREFAALLDLDDPCDREHELQRLAARDPQAARRLRALLAAAERTAEWLDEPAPCPPASGALREHGPAHPTATERLGSYRIIGEIGRGGMGVVLEAERADGLYDQRVAIKVLGRLFSDTARARFARERRILATLQHPSIARLLDGGITEDGQPFLVMELVDGVPIDVYCRQEQLDLESRITLFLRVCRAVEAAHQRLVVHRDLKPTNILVTPTGEPKLLDFGIARWIAAEGEDPTVTVGRALTPSFASPEQFRGDAPNVATDIYQLGLLLHLLLTEALPFDWSGVPIEQIGETLRTVLPTPPSQRLAAQSLSAKSPSAKSPSPVGHPSITAGAVAGDLDALVLRCLRPEIEERYRSVAALIEDLEAYRSSRPLRARAPTLRYRARKFVQRNFALVTTITATLAVAVILTVAFVARLAEERDRAEFARAEAEEVTRWMLQVFRSANPMRWDTPAEAAGDFLSQGLAAVESEVADRPLLQARIDHAVGIAFVGIGDETRARRHLERAHRVRLAHLEPDDPEVGRTLVWLAQVADPEHRIGYARRASEILDSRLGRDHLDSSEARLALGTLLNREVSTANEAESNLLETVRSYERTVGTDDPRLVRSLSALGHTYILLGRLDEAQRVLQRALSIVETALPGHAMHAAVLSQLGWLSRSRNDFARGERYYRQALDILSEIYGQQSPQLADLWMRRGTLLHRTGDLDAAEAAFRRAVALERTRAEPNETSLVQYHEALAAVLTDLGRADESVQVLRQVLATNQRVRGENSPLTAWSHYELGRGELAAGRIDTARHHLEQAEITFREGLGEGHRWRSWPLHALSDLALQAGEIDRAERLAARALTIRLEGLDPNREEIAETRALVQRIRDARPSARSEPQRRRE